MMEPAKPPDEHVTTVEGEIVNGETEDAKGSDTPSDYDSDQEWSRLRDQMRHLTEPDSDALNPMKQLMNERLRWVERKLRKLEVSARNGDRFTKSRNGKNDFKEQNDEVESDEEESDEEEQDTAEEDTLAAKDKGVKDDENSMDAKENTKPLGVIPEFKRVDWYSFKVCRSVFWVLRKWTDISQNHKANEKQYAVEVLSGKARYYYENQRQVNAEGRQRTPWDPSPAEVMPKESLKEQIKEVPERIRVNSLGIMHILDELHPAGYDIKPFVFLRPYKTIVFLEEDLRKRLTQLEAQWGSVEAFMYPGEVTRPVQ